MVGASWCLLLSLKVIDLECRVRYCDATRSQEQCGQLSHHWYGEIPTIESLTTYSMGTKAGQLAYLEKRNTFGREYEDMIFKFLKFTIFSMIYHRYKSLLKFNKNSFRMFFFFFFFLSF